MEASNATMSDARNQGESLDLLDWAVLLDFSKWNYFTAKNIRESYPKNQPAIIEAKEEDSGSILNEALDELRKQGIHPTKANIVHFYKVLDDDKVNFVQIFNLVVADDNDGVKLVEGIREEEETNSYHRAYFVWNNINFVIWTHAVFVKNSEVDSIYSYFCSRVQSLGFTPVLKTLTVGQDADQINATTQPPDAGRTATPKVAVANQENQPAASENHKVDSVDSVDKNIAKPSGPTVDETVQFIGEKLRAQDINFDYSGDVNYENEQGKAVAASGPELYFSLKESNEYFEQSFWIALDGVDIDSVRTSGSYVVFECKNGLNRIMEQHWTGRDSDTGRYSDTTKVNSARLRCFSSEDAEKVTKALRHLIDLVVVKAGDIDHF